MARFSDNKWAGVFLIASLFLISYLAITGFIDLARTMSIEGFAELDKSAATFALSMRADWLTDILHIIAYFGNWQVFVSLFIILTIVLIRSDKRTSPPLIVGGIIAGAGVVMYILKEIFDRERPTIDTLVDAKLSSFPSGHSMLSVVFYGFIIFYIWRSDLRIFLKLIYTIGLVLLIIAICWGRVYLGAHFLSDVIAGIVAGIGWLSIAMGVYMLVKIVRPRLTD